MAEQLENVLASSLTSEPLKKVLVSPLSRCRKYLSPL